MEHLIGKRIKITTPTNRVFYGKCIYILQDVHVGVLYDNGIETAFNTNDGVKVELDSVDLPQAIETTEILNEVKADKGILTEEELKELLAKMKLRLFNDAYTDFEKVVASHINLFSANADVSFKNAKIPVLEADNKLLEETCEELEDKLSNKNEEICRLQDEISTLRGENNHE